MDQSIAGNDAGAGMNMGEATLERMAGLSRRNFLKMAVATSVAMGAAPRGWTAEQTKEGMPYRLLGRTGERVSAIGLGGYHIGETKDEKEGIGIIRSAIDRGINFMDNCWDYHGHRQHEDPRSGIRGGADLSADESPSGSGLARAHGASGGLGPVRVVQNGHAF